MSDLANEALDVISDTGPEYEAFGGAISLANHGPMVIDALCALGRAEDVVVWAERYRRRLAPRPPGQARVDRAAWEPALGDMGRVRDWADFFENELAEGPWTEVLDRWVPLLAPGMVGGLHGTIRTAHAARNLGRAETPLRIRELAEGLAYWAAQYQVPPWRSGPSAALLPSEALGRLEQLDLPDRTGWIAFTEPIGKLARQPSFASAPNLIDTGRGVEVIELDLARAFAALLIANNPSVNPRAFCHGLTGGTTAMMMFPYLSPGAAETVLRHCWQTAAAFYCALAIEPPITEVEPPDETVEEIIDEAIDCPDEHGIKVTEVCLRTYSLDPDPIYLVAAITTTRRLNEVGLDLY